MKNLILLVLCLSMLGCYKTDLAHVVNGNSPEDGPDWEQSKIITNTIIQYAKDDRQRVIGINDNGLPCRLFACAPPKNPIDYDDKCLLVITKNGKSTIQWNRPQWVLFNPKTGLNPPEKASDLPDEYNPNNWEYLYPGRKFKMVQFSIGSICPYKEDKSDWETAVPALFGALIFFFVIPGSIIAIFISIGGAIHHGLHAKQRKNEKQTKLNDLTKTLKQTPNGKPDTRTIMEKIWDEE